MAIYKVFNHCISVGSLEHESGSLADMKRNPGGPIVAVARRRGMC
jgi:hypothetical protein